MIGEARRRLSGPGARAERMLRAMREQDVEAVRGSYEALNRKDIEGTVAVLAPDAEWHESSELPDSDVFIGREAVRRFLQGFLEQWSEFRQEVEEVTVEGERAAVFIHLTARGRGSGANVDARYAHLWTVRGGLGVRVDAYYDRDAALRALTSPCIPAARIETQKTT